MVISVDRISMKPSCFEALFVALWEGFKLWRQFLQCYSYFSLSLYQFWELCFFKGFNLFYLSCEIYGIILTDKMSSKYFLNNLLDLCMVCSYVPTFISNINWLLMFSPSSLLSSCLSNFFLFLKIVFLGVYALLTIEIPTYGFCLSLFFLF